MEGNKNTGLKSSKGNLCQAAERGLVVINLSEVSAFLNSPTAFARSVINRSKESQVHKLIKMRIFCAEQE